MCSSTNRNASALSHQAVVQMEGNNKLVTSLKGLKSVTELNGDTITHVSGEERSVEAWCRQLPPGGWP